MLHRPIVATTKVKDLDIIHLKEPRHLPENIRLVYTKAQVARNPFGNQMEGSKFTPVNTPKALEAPKSPTSTERIMSSIVAKPIKAAYKASNPEDYSTPNIAIKPKKASKPSTLKGAATPSTPIQSKEASKSSSSGGSKTSTIAIKPEAGPQSTSSVESGTSAFKIELEDLTNRNKISVDSLKKALTERGLDVDEKETRPILTVRLILCMSKLGLDGSKTVLQSRVAELLSFRMHQLKARLTQLNADAKGTNKVELIERILEAEQALAQTSGDDAGEGSSGSSPTLHGGHSTTPSSGADRNRRGSSTQTPASSNVSPTAGKLGGSKKRRRTDDANDADDEKQAPKLKKRQKTKDADPETVVGLSSPAIRGAANAENVPGLEDGDVDMSDTPGDGKDSMPPTREASAANVHDGHNQVDGHVDGVSDLSSPLATSTPKMAIPRSQVPAKGKKRESAVSTDPFGADTQQKLKQRVGVPRPKASAKSKKPQKSAVPIASGVAAGVDSQQQAGTVESNVPAKGKESQKLAIAFLDGGEIPFLAAGAEKSKLSDFFPSRLPNKGKEPQKPARATSDGSSAELESKKRKREDSANGDLGNQSTQITPEKPHKRMKLVRPQYKCPAGVLTPLRAPLPEELPQPYWVSDNEASDTDDEVEVEKSGEVDEPMQLEEPQQLEEPTQLKEFKQSEVRKQPNDFFVFNGTLDTRILFEDTMAPPKVLNATFRILTGCGNMDDVNNVHDYRSGLKKYRQSYDPELDRQKKGWRKWWAVQTFWEGRVSEIELSTDGDGQSNVEDEGSDAGTRKSRVNGEHIKNLSKQSNIRQMQPEFDNVEDEIMYDCTDGATTGDELKAFNQRISERDDPTKNANKHLKKIESVWLDMIYPPGSFSLDAYYKLLWKPEADQGMSKEEKLELREKEKAMMKLTGIQVASEEFCEIRMSHDRRW